MTDDRLLAAHLLALSPYSMSIEDALAHIRARRAELLSQPPPPEPNFGPEPMPVIDEPEKFAADFWSKRRPPNTNDEPPKPKPKRPKGRRPTTLGPRHSKFEVFDGGAGDNGK